MRGCLTIAALVASGCAFQVPSADPPAGGGGPPSNPPQTQSPPPSGAQTPPSTDGGAGDMAVVPVGAACNSNSQCGNAGLFCAQSFFAGKTVIMIPGGYCTMDCGNGGVCPAGSSCATFSFGHFCQSSCPPDPCRGGYKCCASPGINGCTPDQLCPD